LACSLCWQLRIYTCSGSSSFSFFLSSQRKGWWIHYTRQPRSLFCNTCKATFAKKKTVRSKCCMIASSCSWAGIWNSNRTNFQLQACIASWSAAAASAFFSTAGEPPASAAQPATLSPPLTHQVHTYKCIKHKAFFLVWNSLLLFANRVDMMLQSKACSVFSAKTLLYFLYRTGDVWTRLWWLLHHAGSLPQRHQHTLPALWKAQLHKIRWNLMSNTL